MKDGQTPRMEKARMAYRRSPSIDTDRHEQGGALIMSLFLTIFVVGIVVTGTSVLKSNRARTETAFLLTGQAAQFARSGLTDAIN